jgi:hypothetical protein
VLFQVLLPLFAPVVDIFTVYGLCFLDPVLIGALWLGFLAAQALSSAYALRLDGERLRVLWTLPLMQLVYRPLLCLVVVQSTVTALVGAGLRWGRLQRHGQASATLARAAGTGGGAGG